MPKSPDGKLSSPRLCLKFHRDNLSYTNQKSRDSNEPQYKSYSVTNMSVDSGLDHPMFSPADSPASSVDSDLYNPGLDNFSNFSGSRLKISIPEEENSKQDSRSSVVIPALRVDGHSVTDIKEVYPDQVRETGDQNSDQTSTVGTTCDVNSKSPLKPMETLPFQATLQWSESQNEDSLDLPDLEIDTSDSIPTNKHESRETLDLVQECDSVSSTSIRSPGQSGLNHSSVTSSTDLKEQQELLNAELENANTSQVTNNSVESSTKESNHIDAQSENVINKVTEMSVTAVTSDMLDDSCSCATSSSKTEDSDKLNNIVPCSPNRTERDSKDSRPNTPKVPPLKIIIPPKSQTICEPTDISERLKNGNKSALPYVINPFQDQGREAEVTSKGTGPENEPSDSSAAVKPDENLSYSDVTNNSYSEYVTEVKKEESDQISEESVENEDMEIEYSDVNSVKPTQDNEVDEKEEDSKSDCDSKRDESKKDEPTQRVLRSAVRSQQLSTESKPPKQQKQQDKSDRSSKSFEINMIFY